MPASPTDLSLKVLFRTRPGDLLRLTGDAGARVRSARVLELQSARRTVDFVLELRLGRESYLRHLEFQSRHRPDLPLRLFDYATRLIVQSRLPVATTVVYLRPPAPPGPLVFSVGVRGRELNRWRFDAIHLWKLPARTALEAGPGVMALVPLMRGHSLALLQEAARRIQREAAPSEQPDLLAVLRVLGERRYTRTQLARLAAREVLMQSGLWRDALAEGRAIGKKLGRAEGRAEGRVEGRVEGRAEGRVEGRAEGRAEGRVEGQARGLIQGQKQGRAEGRLRLSRELCATVARRHHPELIKRLLPVIERCTDERRLRAWIVAPERLVDEALPVRGSARASRAQRRARPKGKT